MSAAPEGSAPSDLRAYLELLAGRGDLKIVDRPISTEFEIAAMARRSADQGGPAFLMNVVLDRPGFRVSAASYCDLRRVVLALGTNRRDAATTYIRATRSPLSRTVVPKAPVQDTVIRAGKVDLERLPIVKHSERDTGYYITGGVQVTRDPNGDVEHLGIHRMMRFNGTELGLWAAPDRRVRRAIERHEQLGQDTPMAVVIGGPPAFVAAACARVPHTVDKIGIAGALLGAPLSLVACKTVDLLVPASAEIVIEGYVKAGERRTEGPFGEFTGCYGRETNSPVFHVTCITMRSDPIYQDFLTGFPMSEDQALMYLPRCAAVYESATAVHQDVRGVHWLVDTGNIYGVVVSIKKRLESEAWNVIASVLAGPALVKQCIVVDEDIDVFDAEAVQWALSTRVRPERDIHVFPSMVGAPLDPSAARPRESSKVGYDATIPLNEDADRYRRVRVPGEDTVDW